MGYYINFRSSNAVIKKDNLDEAYRLMCELNKRDDLKSGGSWSNGGCRQKWFSWMDADYPDKLNTAKEIIDELGFETFLDDEGDLYIENYDSKTGDELHFFRAIGHLVEGRIEWIGEDSEMWCWDFSSGELKEFDGEVVYKDTDSDI